MDELGQLLKASATPSSKSASPVAKGRDWLDVDDEIIGDEEESEEDEDYNNNNNRVAATKQEELDDYDDTKDAYDCDGSSEFDSILVKQEELESRVVGGGRCGKKRSSREEGRLLKEGGTDGDAVALKRKKIGLTAMKDYFFIDDGSSSQKNDDDNDAGGGGSETLVSRCKRIVVANLERYPTNVIGMLDEDNWDEIMELRHRSTQPKSGQGGLDGTGRKKPAMDAKLLQEIEQQNPHLAESKTVDDLFWKDCVNFRFHKNSIISGIRPLALLYPWPILIQTLQDHIRTIQQYPTNDNSHGDNNNEEQNDTQQQEQQQEQQEPQQIEQLEQALRALQQTPMNVTLLKESGVGKSLKKIIKTCTTSASHPFLTIQFPVITGKTTSLSAAPTKPMKNNACGQRTLVKHLQKLLDTWMEIAKSNGVKMDNNNNNPRNSSATATAKMNNEQQKFHQHDADLRLAVKCPSWRKLYLVLKNKEEHKRQSQGEKMRLNRKKLARDRPKVVKVRHEIRMSTKFKAGSLTNGRGISGLNTSSDKHAGSTNLLKIRKEATVAARMSKGKPAVVAGSFSNNVAFAQCMKKTGANGKGQSATFVAISAGKQMKMPLKKQSNLVATQQQQQRKQQKQQLRQRLGKKRLR